MRGGKGDAGALVRVRGTGDAGAGRQAGACGNPVCAGAGETPKTRAGAGEKRPPPPKKKSVSDWGRQTQNGGRTQTLLPFDYNNCLYLL